MPIQSVANVNLAQNFASSGNANTEVSAEVRAVANNGQTATTAAQSGAPRQEASPQQVREAAQQINAALQRLTSSNLEFSVDEDTGQTIVRVVDIETKDVIRQIPNEEALEIAKSLDNLQGVLIRQKA